MNFSPRLMSVLSIVLAGVSLAACHRSDADVKFIRFDGHHMIVGYAAAGDPRYEGHLALDSGTGNPLYFVFVDNTSSVNPDGSYKHPYPTLTLAEANSGPGNIIYVFPGDGTTSGMDSGIALQANQKFLGAGSSHVVQTSQGGVTIPAVASSAPRITNTAGDGITLAIGNDISGFILPNVSDNGIFGSNPESVRISSCVIDNSQLDQIHLEYSASSGSITLDNLVLTNGGQKAIFVDSIIASPSMDFTLSNSVIRSVADHSIDVSFVNEAHVRLANNTIEGNGAYSSINLAGPSTLLVSGNVINNNTSISNAPLSIIAGTGPFSAVIDSNTIGGNTSGAVQFVLNDTDSVLSLTRNIITNNGIGSVGFLGSAIFINPNGTSSGNSNLVLSNNIISGNTGHALFGINGSFDDFQMTASDNRIIGNGGGGFIFANAANTFTLTATNNVISGGGDHGISTGGGLTLATARMTLSNNQITENTNFANGVALSHTGTDLNFVATNNIISENDTSGIVVFSSGTIQNVVASIENNTISNNQNLGSNTSGGVDLEQFTNLSLDLNNNMMSNNAGSGVFIGSAEPSPSVCLEMTGNDSGTDYVFSSGTGVFNLAPINAALVNVGTITTIGTITSVPSCP